MNEKYAFGKYLDKERWTSYWHQIDEILKCAPERVLEVGVGDKVVGSYIKANCKDIFYQSADISPDLVPDIIASVEKIDVPNNSFDAVCAFEVLEHLPFDKFGLALKEMGRVSGKYILISLPHWGRHFGFQLRLPYLGKRQFQFKVSFLAPRHSFDGQHYWEIGKKGYPLSRVKAEIKKAGFDIKKDYVAFDSPYHHFFVLQK